MKHYQEIIDEIFGSTYQERTLRTLFDPNSLEWEDTTIDKKLEILKKILDSGKISMTQIITSYKFYYSHEVSGKGHVIDSLEQGLAILLAHSLK